MLVSSVVGSKLKAASSQLRYRMKHNPILPIRFLANRRSSASTIAFQKRALSTDKPLNCTATTCIKHLENLVSGN